MDNRSVAERYLETKKKSDGTYECVWHWELEWINDNGTYPPANPDKNYQKKNKRKDGKTSYCLGSK